MSTMLDETTTTTAADNGSYDYVRYTPVRKDDMSKTTKEQDRELADRILDDPIFSAELNFYAKQNLASDDPDLVYKGLGTVFAMEFKIQRLGGWVNFIQDKRAVKADPADIDPLANDTALSGTEAALNKRVAQPSVAQIRHELSNLELVTRATELLNNGTTWSRKMVRLLKSNNSTELRKGIEAAERHMAELEEQAKREANPLPYMQKDAAQLSRELIKRMVRLSHGCEERLELMYLVGEIEVAWSNLTALKEAVNKANLKLNPPAETEPILPPVHTGIGVSDIDWKDGVGTIGAPNQQGSGTPSRGDTIPKSLKARTKGHKGGGVKGRPTRKGASPVQK